MFNGELLRVVREFRDMNQRELADRVAVSASAISLYENGKREPEDEIVAALCDELGVLRSFFDQESIDLDETHCNFRSRRRTPVRLRKRVVGRIALLAAWIKAVRQFVRMPAFDVPRIHAGEPRDIEAAAEACREHWDLGLGPIQRVPRVLENAGVVVAQIEDDATQIDAFSSFGEGPKIVALSMAKGSASRAVFDLIHELGHGVLHRDGSEKADTEKEAEANRFAGAFLLPRASFAREFWAAGGTSLGHLVELKARWGVSISAMIYRAHELDLVNTAQYRRWMKTISRHGWRSGTPEPSEPDMPTPELLPAAAARYLELAQLTPQEAADEMGWSPELFGEITGIQPSESTSSDSKLRSLTQYRAERAAES